VHNGESLRRFHNLIDNSTGSIGGSVGHQCIQFPIIILGKTMNRDTIREHGGAAKLRQRERRQRAGLKVGIEQPAIRPDWRGLECQVAEDVFSMTAPESPSRDKQTRP
jgi:hypothetical protein